MEGARIDKWLWAVRLFKTRSMAAEACKANRVLVNGQPVKPSRDVKVGDEVSIRKMPAVYRFRILELTTGRQPAKHILLYREDITPEEELAKLDRMAAGAFAVRDRGAGRPTKKDRREIEGMMEWDDEGWDFDDDE